MQKYGENGAFARRGGRAIGPRDVTDGTGLTAAFAECVVGDGNILPRDRRRTVFQTPSLLLAPSEFERFVAECRDLDIATAAVGVPGRGSEWLDHDLKQTLYNHVISVNGTTCTNAGYVPEGAWTAGSLHSGAGAHTLFLDGHVAFQREATAGGVWRAIGSRNGAEVIGGEP